MSEPVEIPSMRENASIPVCFPEQLCRLGVGTSPRATHGFSGLPVIYRVYPAH